MEDNKNFAQENDKSDIINDDKVNNLMLLYQVHPKVSYTVIPKNGVQKPPMFIAECKIDDTNTFYGEGLSKQKAKLDAATAALKYLNQINQITIPQKKRSASKDVVAPKPKQKIIKQEVPSDFQHVMMAVIKLFPKLQYIFPASESPTKVCQVEINGRMFTKEGLSKKIARMNVCGEIIRTMYGSEHLEILNDVIYVRKSFWQDNRIVGDNDTLPLPRICKNLHPTLYLNNIFRNLKYNEATEKQVGLGHKQVYTLDVEGRLFTGCANTKKNAKFNCAINAINGLQDSGGMLEERLEMAKIARRSAKKAKYDMYNKNKTLGSDPRIRNMIGARNFKFTNFKKSATSLEPNQGIMYASNFDNDENNYHQHARDDNKFHQPYLSTPSQLQPVFQSNIYQQQQSFSQQHQLPQHHEDYYNQQASNTNRYLNNNNNDTNNFNLPYNAYNQIKSEW